ncbi:MAG: HDOD domain-containing protein [Candidatus Acidiferrales bacterium]
MSALLAADIRERVSRIEVTPTIPAVLLPLLKLLKAPAETVNLEDVVRLVSYDNTIAAQCLRMAGSPLFGMAKAPDSVKAAVLALGMRRVQTILLTCCLGQAFPADKWVVDPTAFWKHSLGCAMVCRKLSEKLGFADGEKAYMAGLLHDIGITANSLAFPAEFKAAMELARREEIPLDRAELAVMGFTHCDSGTALAEKWKLPDETIQVIAHHHALDQAEGAQPLVALVHLSDLLCRMRDMGYGYYERLEVDLLGEPAWVILTKERGDLEAMDLARFTFELDESVGEVSELVATVFGGARATV